MNKTTLPSFFSVSRAIQYSDGLLTAVMANGANHAIPVKEFSVRGAKSSHGDAYKLSSGDAKVTKDINSPNPQVVDGAFLPFDSNRLSLSFSMNVLPVSTEQQACNDFSYTEKVRDFLKAFKEKDGFTQLAKLITWRIANASVLWRNRYGVGKTVVVKNGDKCWSFNSDDISLTSPDNFNEGSDLTDLIANALAGNTTVLMLEITSEVTIGFGQEIFPSQELEMKKEKNGKSKKLYSIQYHGAETAAMHPQKIGAAIRAFDIWHPAYAEAGPLSIEPLGYSHKHQYSFRTINSETDLYAYLQNIDSLTEELKVGPVTHQSIYVAACFMRGGVFSGSADAEEKARIAAEKAEEKARIAAEKAEEKAKKASEKKTAKNVKGNETPVASEISLTNGEEPVVDLF